MDLTGLIFFLVRNFEGILLFFLGLYLFFGFWALFAGFRKSELFALPSLFVFSTSFFMFFWIDQIKIV